MMVPPGRVASSGQVFDIPPAALMVTEYQMMRRTCGCGQVTTAAPPLGVTGGPACDGPGVVAAATLLASTDVIGIERAADLMGALLKAPVSAGFVSRCLVRLDAALTREGLRPEERVHVLAQCGHDDYLRINRVCDAMLDTLHWSGGNTSLDALAFGLPIVTLPGRYMRGRQSAGMLRLMGIDELVATDADEYLRIATRLALDADWRSDIASLIAAGQGRIFGDPAPVTAFAEALRRMVGAA